MYKLVNDVILNIRDAKNSLIIEKHCFYDSVLQGINFDDFLKEYVSESFFIGPYLNTNILFCGDIKKKAFKKYKLSKLKKHKLVDMYNYFTNSYSEIDGMLKNDFLDALENISIETFLKTCTNETDRILNIDDEIYQYSDLITFNCVVHNINGFSQGDLTIVIDTADNNFDYNKLQNLFYNCPITAEIIINDCDLNILYNFNWCDFEYEYNFDKDSFISKLKLDLLNSEFDSQLINIVVQYARDNMPCEPYYN